MNDLSTTQNLDAAKRLGKAETARKRAMLNASKEVDGEPILNMIDSPPHYCFESEIKEVRDIQKELCRDLVGQQACDYGNVLKYTLRAPKKEDFRSDLEKAHKYLGWLIEALYDD